MPMTDATMEGRPETSARAALYLREYRNDIYTWTDRLFAKLMIAQWIFGICLTLWVSPRTWIGASSEVHWHVFAAVFLGGMLAGLPVRMVWLQPGRALTRHTIAVAQMLTSALLIHLMGGRIEAHFHIFGSLAFLAFYRDWRVIVTATIVVAADHMLRGLFWPESIFGVLTPSSWRWLEHSGWVIFEDTFLLISMRQSGKEMAEVTARRANLEEFNEENERLVSELTITDRELRRTQEELEERVEARTRELRGVNEELVAEMAQREQAQQELATASRQLIETSRKAGMTEVATGVLHNVGNVLNSVNVSSSLLLEKLRASRAPLLAKATALLQEHSGNLGEFLVSHPSGMKLPGYLVKLGQYLVVENEDLLQEVHQLGRSIEHIKEVVAMQQNYAKVSGAFETLDVRQIVEDAISINGGGFERHGVAVERCFSAAPPVRVDRHRALQILINLLRNAKHALDDTERADKRITISIAAADEGRVRVAVADNGIGIPEENLTRIFAHGFTTRKEGHGFGLHSGALAAREMGGAITAASAGTGRGATFTLELPIAPSNGAQP
jgi:signal transduction histidine kinase